MILGVEMSLADQIVEFFTHLFGTESWPPRWHCGRWTDFHGWLYIISDLAIATSYFAIPMLLIKFVTNKKDVPLPAVFWLFGAFILLCGLTHWLDAFIFWWPAYRLSALLRFFTAIVSVLTLFALIRLLNEALLLKTSKQFEAELMKRQELELSLIKAKEDAQESQKVKEQFLANMSHEIRTPMNAIIGFTRLLQDSKLNAEQKEWLHAIGISGENLLVIINDILDFSKMEAGKLIFNQDTINLEELVSNAVSMVKNRADEKNIKLRIEPGLNLPKLVLGDAVRLNQVLLNLLSNAVKFTQEGEVLVRIKSEALADDKWNIKFSVVDTGIGIKEEQLSEIFESFTQANSKILNQFGGTGLGLAISKRLVELQGGTIGVESKFGKGSTFYFNLYFNQSTMQDSTENRVVAKVDVSLIEGANILLIEDNKINQKLAKAVLSKWNINLDLANSGAIGLEMLAQKQYHLILMDIQMPVMDGYQTTAFIRNELKSTIPIIAMTAHALKSEIDKCLEAGMNDYVSKPFDADDLLRKITQLLS